MIVCPTRATVVALLAFGFQLVMAAPASAVGMADAVYSAPPLENTTDDATRVARIRIVTRTPEYIAGSEIGPDAKLCGYLLTANVVEALKGGKEQFRFFMPVAGDFQGFDKDYFAIVFSHHGLAPDLRTAMADLSDLQMFQALPRVNCVLRNLNYVPDRYQTLWVFDKEAKKKWGNEWLLAASRGDGLFCGHQAKDVFPRHTEVKTWKSDDGSQKFAVKWVDVKRAILALLGHATNSPDYGMCATNPPIPGFSYE